MRERTNTLPGVVSTTVSLTEETAEVTIQEEKVSLGELIDVIERAGFKASLISVEPLE